MINVEGIGANREQNFMQTPRASSSNAFNVSNEPANDIQADKAIKRARAMLSLQRKTNLRAVNLMQMAETALKNGNQVSANDFAKKVLTMLSLKEKEAEIPVKTDIQPVEPRVRKPVKYVEGGKRHTEHTYQDASNDPGVSFSYPGQLTGPESFLAVPAHEKEHVRRSISEAMLNGEKVLVYVSYRVRYDPATGEPYMAGGVTRTIKYPHTPPPAKGKKIDLYV